MLEGTAFIAIVTAVITSTFVARASREAEAARMKDELSDRERAALEIARFPTGRTPSLAQAS
jgi:hypothetical protein